MLDDSSNCPFSRRDVPFWDSGTAGARARRFYRPHLGLVRGLQCYLGCLIERGDSRAIDDHCPLELNCGD